AAIRICRPGPSSTSLAAAPASPLWRPPRSRSTIRGCERAAPAVLERALALLVGWKEHLDAELLKRHVELCPQRGLRREQIQRQLPSTKTHGDEQMTRLRDVGSVAEPGQ